MNKMTRMMIGWSIVSASAMALILAVWYLKNGSVPVVHSLKLTPKCTYILPFGISRWWDCLFVVPFACAFVSSIVHLGIVESRMGVNVGMITVFIFFLFAGASIGVTSSMAFGFPAGIVVSVVFGFVSWMLFSASIANTLGLFLVLVVGLIHGLIFIISAYVALGLIFGLIRYIRIIPAKKIAGYWLLGK